MATTGSKWSLQGAYIMATTGSIMVTTGSIMVTTAEEHNGHYREQMVATGSIIVASLSIGAA